MKIQEEYNSNIFLKRTLKGIQVGLNICTYVVRVIVILQNDCHYKYLAFETAGEEDLFFKSDIAIITMNFAFEIGSYSVNPICLPVNIDSKRFWKNLRRYFIAGKIWHSVELEMI